MVDICPPVFPLGPPLRTGVSDPLPSAYLNLLSRPPVAARVLHEGRALSGYQKFRNSLSVAPMPANNSRLSKSSS